MSERDSDLHRTNSSPQ